MKKTLFSREEHAENTLASEALAMFMELQNERLVQLENDFGDPDHEKPSNKLRPILPFTRNEPGVGRLEIWTLDPTEELLHKLLANSLKITGEPSHLVHSYRALRGELQSEIRPIRLSLWMAT